MSFQTKLRLLQPCCKVEKQGKLLGNTGAVLSTFEEYPFASTSYRDKLQGLPAHHLSPCCAGFLKCWTALA
jgi:hypothetical protein